jgi:antitoxin (DNA-binding transcriptional repressor) of toxin-antitoxin stability system
MDVPRARPTEVSVRQFVNDSGSVTRGLREGKRSILTINGEPLAEVKPIKRRRFVPTAEAQAVFATAPAIDCQVGAIWTRWSMTSYAIPSTGPACDPA